MSDTDEKKVKIYKNPDRNRPMPYKPYVPQYQAEGIEPKQYQGAIVPGNTKIARPSANNPREGKVPSLHQSYADTIISSPIGRGPVPNVGNNMEHTWSSVDGEIVDDLSNGQIDDNHSMIDNNVYVSDAAFGFRNSPLGQERRSVHESTNSDDILSVLNDLENDSYLLIVANIPLCSGPKEEIEDQARALVFGEHEMCDGNPVPTSDIIILKSVKVKIGLFLE